MRWMTRIYLNWKGIEDLIVAVQSSMDGWGLMWWKRRRPRLSDIAPWSVQPSLLEPIASPSTDARIHEFLGWKWSGDGGVPYPGNSWLGVASRWGHSITFLSLGSGADEGHLWCSFDLKEGSYNFPEWWACSSFAPIGAKMTEMLNLKHAGVSWVSSVSEEEAHRCSIYREF
jgi:hypothetical protein